MKKITRRNFIGGVASTASSVAFISLTGCDLSNSSSYSTTSLSSISNGSAYFPQSIASGDPKPDSVILWARVEDAAQSNSAFRVRIQVAKDPEFSQVVGDHEMVTSSADDGVIKLRLALLFPDTTYYYRFLYDNNNAYFASNTGRTKTAPDANSTRAIKFAYMSCQDYIGRYYNTYLKLLDEDLDFVVHLGDYIYETTGDPRFQTDNQERRISFDDTEGAIQVGEGEDAYYAASSLSNYRQLYKTVRSDEVIQKLHESFPMIAIWDDHEFADDSFGSTSTITSGREQEQNESRKRNAEQAYFEFMPLDALTEGSTPLPVLQSQLYPNTRIYRDFVFGQNLHLVMTDFRTNRPDHIIPEDGFAGTVVMDRAQLTIALGAIGVPYDAVKASFTPYVDIGAEMFSGYIPVLVGTLTQGYMAEGLSAEEASAKATEVISGNLATQAINGLLAQYNAAVPPEMQVPLIPDELIATLDTGVAYLTLGKSQLFSSIGSRYFVTKDVYDLYAGFKYAFNGATQNAYGSEQELWYKQTLLSSPARWKVVGSSVSHTSIILDLTNPDFGVPAPFNQKFYLNVDHWDGFGSKRDELLQDTLANVPGSVIIAGDIHASYVADHGQGTFEFTNTSVSSSTQKDYILETIQLDPVLSSIPGLTQLLDNAEALIQLANPSISYANTNANGVAIVTAASDGMQVSLFEAAPEMVFENQYDNAASFISAMTERQFAINDNGELEAL